MQYSLNRAEAGLIVGLCAALAMACFGPTMVQYTHYHEFADERFWADGAYGT